MLSTEFRRLAATAARVALVVGFVAGCSPAPSPSPTATPVPTPQPPSAVKAWLTTTDQASLLAPQPDLAFGTDGSGDPEVYVDENNQYQQMDGFGAAMTDSSAWLLYTQMPEAQRKVVMSKLFSRTDGIGVSVLRLPMGASDLVHGPAYTYDDMPAGETDPTLANFSIDHDRAYIIPALKDALALNPDLKIIASHWSPPAWMKDSDLLGSGTLKPEFYGALAQYWVKIIKAYEAAGVPIYATTIQNEPHYEPGSYPGMRLEPADEASLIKTYLAPAFQAAGIKTRILAWDHNWDNPDYPISVLSDPAANALVDGTAWHCYAGNFMAQGVVHDAFPDKNTYETECSGFVGGGWADDFKNDMSDLVIGSTRYWAKTVIKWPFATNTTQGPNTGGCGTCIGFVTVDPAAADGFTYTHDYYSMGQASKFVQPGAYRIASSGFAYHGFGTVAFKNPDGSKVLIVSNPANYSIKIAVHWGKRVFTYTMPPVAAAVTFTWSGDQDNGAAPAAPANPTATIATGKNNVKWNFSPLADTYTVKRSEQPGGPYAVIASGIGLPEYFDTKIKAGTAYYYVVSATNKLGVSPDSAEVKAAS
jgi:O-glycosyl hydrolase